jgi:hypothetical protein
MKTYKDINGTTFRIEIYYYKGGMDISSFQNQKRGFYLSVTPVKREIKEGYTIDQYMAYSGVKMLLKEVTRYSERVYNEALELGKPKIDELIDFVSLKNNLK